MLPVDLSEKFALFTDHWHPRIVGKLNGQLVKVAKGLGTLAMHFHAEEDEMFLVHKGELSLKFLDDTSVTICAGQFYIVPRGVAHQPVAENEVEIVLFEPMSTAHTGNVTVAETRTTLDFI